MASVNYEIGSPAAVAKELHEFRKSAVLFSGGRSLLGDYDGQWVAAIGGEVCATAESFDGIFEELDRRGLDARYAIIRHIQRNQRTLIL